MIRLVKWKSITELACAKCSTVAQKEVILCVTASKVATKICPSSGFVQPYSYSTIEAEISSYYRSSVINPPKWEYVFSYDDTQLVSGQVLTEADISGAFCDGCFAQWVREIVGDDPYIEEVGENSFVLVTQHGCEYPFVAGGGAVLANLDYIFGDGIDGDLTVLNGETLILPADRNFYFDNLTIDEGGELRTVGPVEGCFQQVFVSGNLTVNGLLTADGQSATGQTAGWSIRRIVDPGANPFDSGAGPGGGDDGGGDGGDPNANGDTNVYSLSWGAGNMAGGHGGGGGDGASGGTGGRGSSELGTFGVFEAGGYAWKEERHIIVLSAYSTGGAYVARATGGGAGGSGGGGGGKSGGTAVGGVGGGGGAGGGSMYVAARNIIIGATGIISANGGDGANGADGVLGTGAGAGGGGGGAGAGGGFIYLIYEDLVNNGIIEVEPGLGGSGGLGVGTLGNGQDGEDGFVGNIHLFNMTTGVMDSP